MHSSRIRTTRALSYRWVSVRGSPWTETPRQRLRDPPRQRPLDRDLLDRDPPGQRPPWTETPGQRPTGQTETPRQRPSCGECWDREPPPREQIDTQV